MSKHSVCRFYLLEKDWEYLLYNNHFEKNFSVLLKKKEKLVFQINNFYPLPKSDSELVADISMNSNIMDWIDTVKSSQISLVNFHQ